MREIYGFNPSTLQYRTEKCNFFGYFILVLRNRSQRTFIIGNISSEETLVKKILKNELLNNSLAIDSPYKNILVITVVQNVAFKG